MNKCLIIYLLLFSFLNFLSWNYFGFFIIGCIIIIINLIHKIRKCSLITVFLYFFIFALSYNVSSTFWLFLSDPFKSVIVFAVNSLLSSVILFLLYLVGKKINNFSILFIWPIFEWLLTKWDIAWPWLILGNSLGNCWIFIKWYNIVGVYGGSLWIILLSWSLFNNISQRKKIILTLLLVLPCGISYYNYNHLQKKTYLQKEKVLLYSPDTINQSFFKQNDLFLSKVPKHPNDSCLIISPELYLSLKYDQFNSTEFKFFTKSYFKKHPKDKLLLGVEVITDENRFNSVTLLDKNKISFKTKKKYVPVTEFTHPLLEPFFGKSIYSKNKDDDSEIIKRDVKTLPFVCYEILFSDYVASNLIDSDYIILMCSEDFMNGCYYAKKQYLNITRLRAIENGRYLVKNSYRGISCLIAPDGNVVDIFDDEFVKVNIPVIHENTIYQKITSKFNPIK